MPNPRPLFIAGLGRSGTTALTRILTAHPAVAIGMERYKFRFRADSDRPLTREDFTRERFFDFTDGATNLTPDADPRWQAHYAALEAGFDDARYVGDKFTHTRLREVWETLNDALFVCIIRDLDPVAASWQARADNPADTGWPMTKDAEAAVAPWNRSLLQVNRAFRARPDQVAVVEYERLYADAEARSLRAVLAWLDLDWDDAIDREFTSAHERYVTDIALRDRALTPEHQAYVDQHRDQVRWNRLLRRAL